MLRSIVMNEYFPVSFKLTLVIVIGFCSMGTVLWMDAGGREV